MVDRFRVVFESGGGWNCACADFLSSNACRHTREAAGRRAAQARIAALLAAPRSFPTLADDLHRRPSRLSKPPQLVAVAGVSNAA
jgi:hypothetical protein